MKPDASEPQSLPLARLESQELERVHREPTPIELIAEMVRGPLTPESAAAIKELVHLKEHMEDRKAQQEALRAFNAAFTKLQKVIPTIKADAAVADGARVLYRYCTFEEIWTQVQPHLTENGFSVRFSQTMDGATVTNTMHLMHEGGHSVENHYTVRSGRGAPGMNETKCDAAASTIGQREVLCDGLNIIRRNRDDDARQLGGHVTPEQADELERRCKMVNADVGKFLKFAGDAKSFAEIPATLYPMLDENLRKKENPRK